MVADPGAPDPGTTDGPSWLEQALHVARTTNDYTPVWPALVNTTFVVPVFVDEPIAGVDDRGDDSSPPPAFHFAVRSSADRPVLVITEQ